MTELESLGLLDFTFYAERVYEEMTAGGFVQDLCIPQVRLAEFLGLSRGTVRNWSSSGSVGRFYRRKLAELCLRQRQVAYFWAVGLRFKRMTTGDPLWSLFFEDEEISTSGLAPPETVSDAVRTLCVTQRDLARLLGVEPSTLRNWKSGIAQPRSSSYAQIANGLTTLVWYLWIAAQILDPRLKVMPTPADSGQ